MTIRGDGGSKIKEIGRSEYLPIRIPAKYNTIRGQYCSNLLTDGFPGMNILKTSENSMNTNRNCKIQYKSDEIDQLLYLEEPANVRSIVIWSHIDMSIMLCKILIYNNISILLHTNSNTTETCSGEVSESITNDKLLLLYKNCSLNSTDLIRSVSLRISNWTGGQIVEIALYSEFKLYERDRGTLIANIYFVIL